MSVRFEDGSKKMIVVIALVDAVGPFTLVLGISDVTVEILREET